MLGLVLEGGGARGAYHVGAVKAYLENGYVFDGFAGTSIGAINAALMAQGDFELAGELWNNMTTENIFEADESIIVKTIHGKPANFTELTNVIKKVVKNGGIDTKKIRAVLEKYIDEDKLRTSNKDFGLVTVSLNERKPYELVLEKIPKGELINYILASASFPGFRPETIAGIQFVDGGLFDNCPVNMLIDKNYDRIIAVKTNAIGVNRKIKKTSSKITVITPNEDLGGLMLFEKDKIDYNMKLGYYDALRAIKELRGNKYYINPVDIEEFHNKLNSIPKEKIIEIGLLLGIRDIPEKRVLYENIIPRISSFLKLKRDFDYADFIIAVLEYFAEKSEIDRFNIYNYDDFNRIVLNEAEKSEREKNVSLIETMVLGKMPKAINLFFYGINTIH